MNATDDGRTGANGVAQAADARLTQALEEYRRLLEAWAAPDRAAFVAQCPEMAEKLAECLSGLEFVHRVAPAVSGAAAETATAADAGAAVGPGAPLGDFRIIREVGRGGMGIVYEAEQLSLGRRVALKVLPFAATLDPRHLQRFHNEARAAAGLHHTNIVPVYGVGNERGVHYYAMQFIEGRTLADLIAEQRREAVRQVPTTDEAAAATPSASTVRPAAQATSAAPRDAAYFRRAAAWGIQAAEALDCAHGLGVVHRDVKPANLLVDGAGRLWVTDFGLAQVQSDARLTMTGDLMGTLRYMSPEQALAKRVVIDHRTDLYSLGATLYELLTLGPAFAGADRQELLRQIAFEEPKPPRRLNRAVPMELETIVLKALEKDPAERYATAQELADDLRRFQEDRPIRARRASVVQRLRKLARRHRAAVGAGAVCLLVALGASGGWILSDRAARQREAEIRMREAEDRIEEALEAAQAGLREGNPANQALLSAAQRVQAQLDSGAVGPELRRRGEQFLRDVQMLADLDQTRLRRADRKEGVQFDVAGAEARYAELFAGYGIDVLALDPAEAALRIRDSAIREALLAGLDDWMHPNKNDSPMPAKPGQGADRARLQQVADAADDNAWRRAFRKAALARDKDKLKALAGQPEALAQPPAVLAWLGWVLLDRGLNSEAGALLRQAQQRHPADFWINYNAAWAGFWVNYNAAWAGGDQQVGYCRAAVAARPTSAEAHSLLGFLLVCRSDSDAAIAAFQQALAVDPRYEVARGHLINALIGKGDLDGAIAACREGLRLNKDCYWAHNQLANVLRIKGRLDDAIAEFREVVRLKKDFSEAHDKLGGALADKGQWDEAIAEYAAAARSYAQAFAAEPEVAEELRNGERYRAACVAALAGCGRGEDAAQLDDQERARLRRQALDWLRADLALRAKQAGSTRPEDRAAAKKALSYWFQDTELAGVRGDALAKLPEAEREAWRQLWGDVAATRARAAAEKQPDPK
jgi:serine/threonine protein kinase/Flp pilus assembly protein TadD